MNRRIPWLAPILGAAALGLAGCSGDDAPATGGTTTTGTGSGGGTTGTTGLPEPVCGNGIVELGEDCDDGANPDPDDGCTPLCTIPACGDGFVQPSVGEACDDADEDDGNGCTAACTPSEDLAWLYRLPNRARGENSVGDVALDPAGNVYVAATVWKVEAHTDIHVMKLAPDGTPLWTFVHDGPAVLSRDKGYGVAVTPDGDVLAAGTERTGSGDAYGAWIARLSPDGEPVWTKVVQSDWNASDVAFGVAPRKGRDGVVGGYTGAPAWLARLDAQTGETVWSRTFGMGGTDQIARVAVGPGGEIYAAGSVDESAWIARLDGDGNTVWEDAFESTDQYYDGATALAVAPDGTVYVAGSLVYGWLLGYTSEGERTTTLVLSDEMRSSVGALGVLAGGDLVVASAHAPPLLEAVTRLRRITPSGQTVWSTEFGGTTGISTTTAVATAPDGGFVLSGFSTAGEFAQDGWVAAFLP